MAAAFVLGIGLTGMQVQWRSLYQQKLAIDVQPGVFKWLSTWGVLATLPPFAFIQAGLFLGWSMPVLLTAVAAAIAAVSLAVPLYAWLSKRLSRKGA
jgi:disulfide bond formation protein DsbB